MAMQPDIDPFLAKVVTDHGFGDRITGVENATRYIEIYEEVSSATGTLTLPTGATIILDQYANDIDSVCRIIDTSGQKPVEQFAEDSSGNICAVTLSGTGNADYTLSHTPTGSQYAICVVIEISEINLRDVDKSLILQAEEVEAPFDYVKFNITAGYTVGVGEIAWNAAEETYDFGLPGGVTGQAFRETFFYGKNTSGVAISNGQPVMFAAPVGASGKVEIQLAIADGSIPSEFIMGIATQDIGIGEFGNVTWFGNVRGIQTDGANYGETWVDGSLIYVSTTTAGALTNIEPQAPAQKILVAAVELAHSTVGTILLRPTWNPKFVDLDDVNGTPLAVSGQIPVWDNDNSYFDFDYNINDYLLKGAFTEGSVLFRGATEIAEDADFTYNSTANEITLDGLKYGGGYVQPVADSTTAFVFKDQTGTADFTYDSTNGYFDVTNGNSLRLLGTSSNMTLYNSLGLAGFGVISAYPNGAGDDIAAALSVVPKGAGFNANIKSQISIFNTDFVADAANYEAIVVRAGGTNGYSFATSRGGSGVDRDFFFSTSLGTEYMRFDYTNFDVLIPNDDEKLKLGDGGEFYLEYTSGGDARIDTGATTSSDLVIDCGTNKTVELAEVVYDDLQVNISNIRVPPANAPTERLYNHGIGGGVTFPVLGFDVGNYIYFDVQTTHSTKLNTILENHIHFILPNTTNIGDKWQFQLDVIAASVDVAYAVPTGSPFTSEHTIVANDNTHHRIMDIADIPAVNSTVSTIYSCVLTRIAASANEYGSEVYLKFNDCHIQKNTLGLRQEYVK